MNDLERFRLRKEYVQCIKCKLCITEFKNIENYPYKNYLFMVHCRHLNYELEELLDLRSSELICICGNDLLSFTYDYYLVFNPESVTIGYDR